MRRRTLLVAGFVAAAGAPLACRKRRRFARYPGSAPPGGPGLRLVYELRPDREPEPGTSRQALVDRTVEVLRRRVGTLTDGGVVRPAATGGVEVFLPQGPAAMYEGFRRIARVPGRFQVLLVDNGSPYMKTLVDSAGRIDGVTQQLEAWRQPNGGDQEDVYLRADDRATLVAAVDKLTAAMPLPPNRAILLERENWAEPEIVRWRTFYVETAGGITNAAIAEVAPERSFDGRPDVQVVLTAQGREAFGAMTTNALGRKIAIVIDGRVETAPVVMTPIPNGRMHILTSSNPSLDPALLKDQVEDLAVILNSGPLPAPLMLLIEEQVPRLPDNAPP